MDLHVLDLTSTAAGFQVPWFLGIAKDPGLFCTSTLLPHSLQSARFRAVRQGCYSSLIMIETGNRNMLQAFISLEKAGMLLLTVPSAVLIAASFIVLRVPELHIDFWQ